MRRFRQVVMPAVAVPMLAGVLAVGLVTVPAGAAYADPVGGGRLGTHGVVVATGTDPLPDVAAASWVVADATTGAVLAAKYPHLRHRPASTLKTLTSVTLMPHLDPTAVHRVTAQEMAPVYGSRAGIVAGATYTVDDLWHALLLPSGNDAAAALAATYGGVKKTVKAMNAEAERLQAKDTHAVNPSGLDANKQYTSAYDMALFARAAIAMPEFTRVSGTVSYDLPGRAAKPGKKRQTFKIYGQNRLLNDGYKGVIAGKTGYTTLAGRTFWVAAKRHGHTVIVTLMGITEETETAARKLMSWGLANDPVATPVGVLVDPVETHTGGGGPSASPAAANAGGGGGIAAAGPAAQGSSSPSTGLLLLGLFLLAALVVVAVEVFWRRRRRRSPAAPAAATPAAPTRPAADPPPVPAPAGPEPVSAPATAAPTGSVVVKQPAPGQPPAEDPGPAEHARPAPVAPTGNVRVVRPPSRPD